MEQSIRLAYEHDLSDIMGYIRDAKVLLATQNSGQWQDQHPREDTIKNDIINRHYYVIVLNHQIVGGFALLDYEKDYEELLEGAWLTSGLYYVIHRFAIHSKFRHLGLASFALQFIESQARSHGINAIRLDTHEKNIPMIKLVTKSGYQRVGVVLLTNFKRRIAFEKVINK